MKGLIRALFEEPALLDEITPEMEEDGSGFTVISYMTEIWRRGIKPEPKDVLNELKTAGENAAVKYLREHLKDELEFSRDYAVQMLKEDYGHRKLFIMLNEGLRRNNTESVSDVLRFMDEETRTVAVGSKPKNMDQAVQDTMAHLQRIHDGTQPATWKTGHTRHDLEIGFAERMLVMIAGQQKQGKCFARGTMVIMANGTRRPIESIAPGSYVMGPDGQPKKVLGTGEGDAEMYRVEQSKGITYTVNEPHILSFKYLGKGQYPDRKHRRAKGTKYVLSGRGEIVNMTLPEYMKLTPGKRRRLKGWKGVSNWPETSTTIDPYLMGVWIGDGDTRDPCITTEDIEVSEWLVKNYRTSPRGNRYFLRKMKPQFRQYGLLDKNAKRIPYVFMRNSEEVRLQLLAGIIDTDGYLMTNKSNGRQRGYEVSQVSDVLAEQIVELGRSLGFECRKRLKKTSVLHKGKKIIGTAWTIWIRGSVHRIPCKIKRKQAPLNPSSYDATLSNLTITPIGQGHYHGITVEGELFMLEDHTVVHNTRIMVNYMMRLLRHNKGLSADFFTFEMHTTEVIICLIAHITGISTSVIKGRSRKPTPDEWKHIVNANGMVKELPITWHDTKMSIDGIRRQVDRNVTEKHMVVIDNLGLIRNERNLDELRHDNEVASSLVDMRDKTGALIFLLHHLSKESESHHNKKDAFEPNTKHLRGSNKWADCLNSLILVHRPAAYPELQESFFSEKWNELQDEMLIKVPITREGSPTRLMMKHKLECCQFVEKDDDAEAA